MLVERHLDLDLLSERGPEQLLGIHDQGIDVGFARLQRLLAGEGEKAPGQLRSPPRRGSDQVGRFRKLRLVGDSVGQNTDDRRDRREHIVEVVRNTAGKLSDGFHLL